MNRQNGIGAVPIELEVVKSGGESLLLLLVLINLK